jgi:hypothetical protein
VAVLEKYRETLEPCVRQPAYERLTDPIERLFVGARWISPPAGRDRFVLGCPIGDLRIAVHFRAPRYGGHPSRVGVHLPLCGWLANRSSFRGGESPPPLA